MFEFCLYKNNAHNALRNAEEQNFSVFNFISSVTVSYLYDVTNCLLQQVRSIVNRLFLVCIDNAIPRIALGQFERIF